MAAIPIVNTADKRKGIITAIIVMTLVVLYLLLKTIALADPPPPDPVVLAETELPEELMFEVIEMSGGADAGSPTDDEVKPPTPQTEQVLTTTNESDYSEPTGNSTNTNANNQTNESSTTTQSNNPFGSGGNNGDTGSGNTFGNDTGVGTGDGGTGTGIVRKRLNDPVFDRLESNEYATITLVVTIDGQGNIVSASCNYSKTTTNNQVLINRVINEVKKQVKYNKDPGAPLAKVALTVKITPK